MQAGYDGGDPTPSKARPMSFFLRVLLSFCVLTLAPVWGGLTAQQAGDRPVLRAVYGDFYPYSFTGADGDADGYNTELTRLLAHHAGYDVTFVSAQNPAEFLDMLRSGAADVTPLLGLTAERRQAGLATSPLGQYSLAVYARRDSDIADVGDLAGRSLGVVDGATSELVARMIPLAQVVVFADTDAMLLPALRGEVDAIVGVSESFEALLRRSYLHDTMRRIDPVLTAVPYGLIIREDLPQVHAAFEQAIARIATPNAMRSLRDRWFGHDRTLIEHPWFNNVAMIIGGTGMAVIALGIYAVRLRRRSARLLVEKGENQLLIDALNQIRAGVVIFDSGMRAVHWNMGFEHRFPDIVPQLRSGGTIAEVCRIAYLPGVADAQACEARVAESVKRLRRGLIEHSRVTTAAGDTFDLSMFRLGTGHYGAIWVDVTQLHRQQEQIASQSAELMRKNQQLMAFSSMAAHDLKAPLVQQATLMEFIVEDMREAHITLPAEAQINFDTLADLSRRMKRLVHDLLDYARADQGQVGVECFVLSTRLDAVLKLSARAADIRIEMPDDLPAVRVPPHAFDMVLRNLISNAIKHNDQAVGKITLRGRQEADFVVLEVEDDGPGIAPEEHDHVFEPFARLTKVEGTGLGLAFVKKTVVGWGGTVAIADAAGRGCIFRVTLPLAVAADLLVFSGPGRPAAAGPSGPRRALGS